MWDGKWVPYASFIVHELVYNPTNQLHYVRLTANGKALKIPACASVSVGAYCPLTAYDNIIRSFLPPNTMCGRHLNPPNTNLFNFM